MMFQGGLTRLELFYLKNKNMASIFYAKFIMNEGRNFI